LVLICCFQRIYLDQLAQDPAALARSDYLCLLVNARRAHELFRREHDLTYVFPSTYKQIQAFLAQHEKPPVSVFFLLSHRLYLLSFGLVPLSILLQTGLLLKLPLLRYAPFSSFFCSIGYLSPAFRIQGLPSPAAATDGHTDNEHEVEVIMLASENNIPSALLSHNSGPVHSLIISSMIGFLTASSFVRVLWR